MKVSPPLDDRRVPFKRTGRFGSVIAVENPPEWLAAVAAEYGGTANDGDLDDD